MACVELCEEHALQVILNHRIEPSSPVGHYSVLVRLGAEDVFLHDPQFGPSRHLSRNSLLKLWCAEPGSSDIAGCVLVAFANTPPRATTCPVCNTTSPLAVRCPTCLSPIPLHPAAVLGCVAGSCQMRTWERVFCPQCDQGISDLTGLQSRAAEGTAGENHSLLLAQYSRMYLNEFRAIQNDMTQGYAVRSVTDFRELFEKIKERLEGVQARLRAEFLARTGLGAPPQKKLATAPAAESVRLATQVPPSPSPEAQKPIGEEILDQEQIQKVIQRLLRDHHGPAGSAQPSYRFPR